MRSVRILPSLASSHRSDVMALSNCSMWPPTQVTNGCLRLAAQALPYFTKVNITGRYTGRQIVSFVERWKNRIADALSPKGSKKLLISGFGASNTSSDDARTG